VNVLQAESEKTVGRRRTAILQGINFAAAIESTLSHFIANLTSAYPALVTACSFQGPAPPNQCCRANRARPRTAAGRDLLGAPRDPVLRRVAQDGHIFSKSRASLSSRGHMYTV
jgi:hypothetical protein